MTDPMTNPPWAGPPDAPWLALADGGQTVWVSLAHVRQVLFCENEPGGPCALLWSGDDLWEIGDPAALRALRLWVQARALPFAGASYGEHD